MIYTNKLPEGCHECPCCNDDDCGAHDCNLMENLEWPDDSSVWYLYMNEVRSLNCPLTLIERWRLESCHTCNGKACQAFTSHEFTGATCEDWQPIENNLI